MSIIRFDLNSIRNLVTEVNARHNVESRHVVLVRDRGVYMTAEGCSVVFAEGCDPASDAHWSDTALALAGPDSFHERIDLEQVLRCCGSASGDHDAYTIRVSPRDLTMVAGYLSKPRDRYRSRSSDGMGVAGLCVRLTAAAVVSESDLRTVVARALNIASPLRNSEVAREKACVVTGKISVEVQPEGEIRIAACDIERGPYGPVEFLPQDHDTEELAAAHFLRHLVSAVEHIGLQVTTAIRA